MIVGKVAGTVVATRKDERLVGFKLLVVRPLRFLGADSAEELIAVDSVGAGVGETVLVVRGSQAARALGDSCPVDAVIVGIVDAVEVVGR